MHDETRTDVEEEFTAAAAAAQGGGEAGGDAGQGAGTAGSDDVVDAEFTEVKDDAGNGPGDARG